MKYPYTAAVLAFAVYALAAPAHVNERSSFESSAPALGDSAYGSSAGAGTESYREASAAALPSIATPAFGGSDGSAASGLPPFALSPLGGIGPGSGLALPTGGLGGFAALGGSGLGLGSAFPTGGPGGLRGLESLGGSGLPGLGSALPTGLPSLGGSAALPSGFFGGGFVPPTGVVPTGAPIALPVPMASASQAAPPTLSTATGGSTYRSYRQRRQDLGSLLGGSSGSSGLGSFGSGVGSLGSLSTGTASGFDTSSLTGSLSGSSGLPSLGSGSHLSSLTSGLGSLTGSSSTPDLSSLLGGSGLSLKEKRQDLGSLSSLGSSTNPLGSLSSGSSSPGSLGSLSSLGPGTGSLSGLGSVSTSLPSLGSSSGSTGDVTSILSGLGSSSGTSSFDPTSLTSGLGSASSGLSSLSSGSSGLSSLDSAGGLVKIRRQDLSSLLGSLSMGTTSTSSETSSTAASPATSASSSSAFGDLGSLSGPTSGLSTSVSTSSYNDVTDNKSCKNVTLIFARGTTETGTMGNIVGPGLASALQSATGSLAVQGVDYPADAAGNANLGASGGPAMGKLATQALAQCPDTKIVLSGYSQGAMASPLATPSADEPSNPAELIPVLTKQVVHNALSTSAIPGSKIAAVAVFGDPLNGQSFSGVGAANVVRYCGGADVVCDLSGSTEGLGSHLSYGDNVKEAAARVAKIVGIGA